jgi:hypothetical protein
MKSKYKTGSVMLCDFFIKRKHFFLTIFSMLLIFVSCSCAQAPSFGEREDRGLLQFREIDEASGIAASRKDIGILWTHNDSGDSARIFAINTHGKHLGIYHIEGITNRDWEDIEVGPGPVSGKEYIYIAEIGDNFAQYNTKYIYRVPEPDVDTNQSAVYATLKNCDIIKFKYPDGPRDAETLIVDPLTKDIYVVSKREKKVNVYLLKYPQSLKDTITIKYMLTLPFTMVVAGDISFNGKEILLKTYSSVYYWKRSKGQSVAEALTNKYYTLPYIREPQGEAIGWSYNADGYYTTSEEGDSHVRAHLYFYPRLK